MFLAGDLGGTKSLLGEFQPRDGALVQVRLESYPSRSYPTFDAILGEFLDGRTGPPIASACLGVAGTVFDGRCHMTNLPWLLEETALADAIKTPKVKLLNDLESTAFGTLFLPPGEVAVLAAGPGSAPRGGNVAVIAAGTGLGEAMLYWDGDRYHPVASEGGHADFSPRDDREVELWKHLRKRFEGHVSFERVLSGPGLFNIYTFLRDEGLYEEPGWLAAKFAGKDPNVVISEHGAAGGVPICVETLAMFASIYGAEAGNAALRCVATGGVYLGGGIAPKLLPVLKSGAFMDAFTNKGRFAGFLGGLKVSVSLNPHAALLGSAHYAASR